ncbi:hypothetical protein BH10PSE9_BH10PSE9_18230 [soil metagenome]
MATGTVKFFNATRGFGFIAPNDGGPDVFVHATAVERAGLPSIVEGDKLSFDVVSERGKTAASNLAKVESRQSIRLPGPVLTSSGPVPDVWRGDAMAYRPNYQQQRGDRNRAKDEKKRERLARREEEAQKRKAEREGLLTPPADGEMPAEPDQT